MSGLKRQGTTVCRHSVPTDRHCPECRGQEATTRCGTCFASISKEHIHDQGNCVPYLQGRLKQALDHRDKWKAETMRVIKTYEDDMERMEAVSKKVIRERDAALEKLAVAEKALESVLQYCEKGEACVGDDKEPCHIYEHSVARKALAKISGGKK